MGWLGWITGSDGVGENHKSSHDSNTQTSKSEKLSGSDAKHDHVWTKTTVDAKTMTYKNESGFVGENVPRASNRK